MNEARRGRQETGLSEMSSASQNGEQEKNAQAVVAGIGILEGV